jgi:hypothetical protein
MSLERRYFKLSINTKLDPRKPQEGLQNLVQNRVVGEAKIEEKWMEARVGK